MFAKVVADRYARALLNSCPDLATIERVKDEIVLLDQVWDRSPDTREFLMNPKIPPQVKTKVLESSLADKLSPLVMKLLVLLIEKHRQDIIPDIADRYTEHTDAVRGVEHAEVIVATPISPDLEKMLIDAIQRFSTRQVEVALRIDPSIIGGVQIKLGDKVIDGSLLHRFREIRRTMLAARLPRLET
jgi:F-type H+-transporting ATPase subunit delta